MLGVFLPIAERYGLMPAIDKWVVQALAQWLNHHRGHVAPSALYAINLSAKSLSDESFLPEVTNIIQRYGVVPSN